MAVSGPGGSVTINSISDGVNGTWPTHVKEFTSLYSGDIYYIILPSNADNTALAITVGVSTAYSPYYLHFREISNADTTTPLLTKATTTNGYGKDGRMGSVVTAVRTLIMGISYDPSGGAGPVTADAGYTLLNLASGSCGSISKVENAGTINPGVTYTSDTGAIGMTLAIQPAAGGGGGATSLPPFRSFPQALLAR